ncbi:MAG TPA: Type 1 glutamine amidotransferase-like domain-containing protein [Actinocatenispora sp.]
MGGCVLLAGGGSPRQEERVWRAAFEGVGRMVYWPFALPDSRIAQAPAWLRAGLDELGIDVEVDAWSSLDGHRPADLGAADLLFVGGGTTSKLARHVHEHRFDQAVRDFVDAGGRYYGGSAGAVLAGASIAVGALADDDDPAAATDDRGLGLVPGVGLLPHANIFAAADQQSWSTTLGQPLLAIPEAGGVRVAGASGTVLGPDPVDLVDGAGRTTYQPGEVVPLTLR